MGKTKQNRKREKKLDKIKKDIDIETYSVVGERKRERKKEREREMEREKERENKERRRKSN